MDFVISVIHPVADFAEAKAFLCDTLGFQCKQATAEAVIVDNGSLAVRLVPVKDTVQGNLHLELHSQNRELTTDTLLSLPNVSLITRDIAIGPQRLESHFQGPQGIVIIVAQEYSEDELDIMPPLPMSLLWDDDAEQCVKQMLRLTPLGFRAAARTRITEQAEMLAGEEAAITVTIANAVRALAEVTPAFQHPALVSALQQHGIEPAPHFNGMAQ
jgi:hypothetical protein